MPGPHPVLAPVGDPRVLPLDRPVTLAGSGPRCRLNLRSSTVSKVHAVLVRDGGVVYVRDLASREGVKVDGDLVRECLLSGGERVEFGKFEFVFEGVVSTRMPPRAPGGSLMGVEIESRTMVIGRRTTCDIVIDLEEVSSAHAILLEHNGRRYVRDLGSRTGVQLNGRRVQWEYLKGGDVITIGGREMVYVEAEAVRAEPKMRLAVASGSVLLGPGGAVEQSTFLSESMSGAIEAIREDEAGVGSGMGSGIASVGSGAAGQVAFDDGTEARDDDPAPRGPLPTGAALFSAAELPVVRENVTGAEVAVSERVPETGPQGAPSEELTYQKVLPPMMDPLAGIAETREAEESLAASSSEQERPADADADNFESMMAGLYVGAVGELGETATTTDDVGGVVMLDFDGDLDEPAGMKGEGTGLGESDGGAELWEGQYRIGEVEPNETVDAVGGGPLAEADEVVSAGAVSTTISSQGESDATALATVEMTTTSEATVCVDAPAEVVATAAGSAGEVQPTTKVEVWATSAPVVDGVRASEGVAAEASSRWVRAGTARDREDKKATSAELGKLLRGSSLIAEVPEEPEATSGGSRMLRAAIRGVVVLAVSAGAGYAGWFWGASTPEIVGRVSVPAGTSASALLLDGGVRERAVARLGAAGGSTEAGELRNDAVLRRWAEGAKMEGGVLTVKIEGDAGAAERLKALLAAAAEKATPVGVSVEKAVATAEDELRAVSAALSAMETKLTDAEGRIKDASGVPGLSAEVREAEKQRDQLATKFESARSGEPATDGAARHKLDEAVVSFRKQLEAAKALPTADQRLAVFVNAAQSVQEQGAALSDEILRSRQEQADRLVSLRKRLAERMRIRQQQAWDGDSELKVMAEELDAARRKLATAKEKNATHAIQDLTGEVEYFEGLVKSRRALVGQDRGDQRALQEVQSIIEEQAQATEIDRRRLTESFEQMRQSLVRALPEAGTVPDVERQLATDLEARLGELQAARAAMTEAAATAISRHQDAVKQLETQLAEAEATLVDKGRTLEMARQSMPTPKQLDDLREKTAAARRAKSDAERGLETAKTAGSEKTVAAETTLSGGGGARRMYIAGGAAVGSLVLLSPLLRSRWRDEP